MPSESPRGVDSDASPPRRFERRRDGRVDWWEIRREGIRCFIGWGRVGGRAMGSTMTLDDERHAARHLQRKIAEQRRKGYVEVADSAPPEMVEEVVHRAGPDYLPVEGHENVHVRHFPFPGGPGPFRTFLMLRDEGRRAVEFIVKDPAYDSDAVSVFLTFLEEHWELAFDGSHWIPAPQSGTPTPSSHHKVELTAPVGRFSHALVCSPALSRSPAGTAMAFPIFDCEIGDADSEVLVDARLNGRHGLPHSTWDRDPRPVIDLRFALLGSRDLNTKKFKVYPRSVLAELLRRLPDAAPDSYLEIRNFRGVVMRLTAADLTSGTDADVERHLLGRSSP